MSGAFRLAFLITLLLCSTGCSQKTKPNMNAEDIRIVRETIESISFIGMVGYETTKTDSSSMYTYSNADMIAYRANIKYSSKKDYIRDSCRYTNRDSTTTIEHITEEYVNLESVNRVTDSYTENETSESFHEKHVINKDFLDIISSKICGGYIYNKPDKPLKSGSSTLLLKCSLTLEAEVSFTIGCSLFNLYYSSISEAYIETYLIDGYYNGKIKLNGIINDKKCSSMIMFAYNPQDN